jgi:hypothetical protein
MVFSIPEVTGENVSEFALGSSWNYGMNPKELHSYLELLFGLLRYSYFASFCLQCSY